VVRACHSDEKVEQDRKKRAPSESLGRQSNAQ
jgi:hypothetical protein